MSRQGRFHKLVLVGDGAKEFPSWNCPALAYHPAQLVGNAIFDRYWTVAHHADTDVRLQLTYNTIQRQPGPGFWQPSFAITMKRGTIRAPESEMRCSWPYQAVRFGLQAS